MDQNATIGSGPEGIAQGAFVGSFLHTLDPKKRLTIPSEWREIVGGANRLYVLPGVDEICLCVFPARDMVQRLQPIRKHSIADPRARKFARVLGSQSQLEAWDPQGRIRVKDALLKFARLESQVVLVGAFESFELWNPDLWEASGTMDRTQFRDAATYLGI